MRCLIRMTVIAENGEVDSSLSQERLSAIDTRNTQTVEIPSENIIYGVKKRKTFDARYAGQANIQERHIGFELRQ